LKGAPDCFDREIYTLKRPPENFGMDWSTPNLGSKLHRLISRSGGF
jgi:hypothetical protein